MNNAKLPITSLLPLIVLGMQLGKATKASLEDGKFNYADMPNFLPVFPYVAPAFENIKDVPTQIADIDESEALELKNLVQQHLGEIIENEKLISQINASLEWIQSTYKLVNSFKA